MGGKSKEVAQVEKSVARVARQKSASKSTPKPTTRMLAYALTLASNPKMSKKDALQVAGYSPETKSYQIEHSPSYRPIAEQLDAAAQRVGITMDANLEVLGQIAYNPDSDNTGRIQAVKEANTMLGWRKPELVEVSQTTNVALILGMVREQGISMGDIIRSMREPECTVSDA